MKQSELDASAVVLCPAAGAPNYSTDALADLEEALANAADVETILGTPDEIEFARTVLSNSVAQANLRPADDAIEDTGQPRTSTEAESYDRWFRAQVKASMEDDGPGVPHEQAMREVDAILEARARPEED